MTNETPDDWYTRTGDDVVARVQVDPSRGLDLDEAARRLEEYGPNEVEARGRRSPVIVFLLQFHQPLIYILIAAGVVTIVLAEYVDAAVIFGVVVLNAAIGYIQEAKALSALDALSRTLASEATVVREGTRKTLPARDLVPGDVVVVQSGDKVPADIRLLRVRELQVDEAPFTGESVPVFKDPEPVPSDAELGDRTSMAFSSTLVTSGQATGVVVATGQATEVGRISELIQGAHEIATPLTRRIASFSRLLLVVILALSVVTFLVGLAHGEPAAGVFLAAVALAVAAIPEGLPAVITITLAIGVSRMATRRAIVRKLPAVETLGSTTVICTDKTGTLTENQMTVQRIWSAGHFYGVTGIGYHPEGEMTPLEDAPTTNVALMRSLEAGILCNDSALYQEPETERWSVRGDPTEGALIVAAHKAGVVASELVEERPRVDAIPFESAHQYMATLHDLGMEADRRVVFVKGAVEAILRRCTESLGADGAVEPLDEEDVMSAVDDMAASGLRVLAFAEMHTGRDQERIEHADIAEGLRFIGLQGMIDPPRQEAIASIRRCKRAGITVKMITGDHVVTAAAIARELGIGHTGLEPSPELPRAMTGRELEATEDDELYDLVGEVDVFARVPPEGKLRLVRALQARHHIVAMTGDGVNDGAALRQADIGVAMGITGTEVAKDASDIVLTDDNFATIAAAVEEGRGVYDNLIKFLIYILPTNLGQALVILFAVLAGTTVPMLPVQVLWVNMTTAVFLGLMLAFEPREAGIMDRPPRAPDAAMLTGGMIARMTVVALLLVAGAYALFYWSESRGASTEEARTVAVNVFIVGEILYLLNCRSLSRSPIASGVLANMWIIYGIATMVVLQLAFTYAPPLNTLFHTEPVAMETWALCLVVGMLIYVVVEAEKALRNRLGRPLAHPAYEPGSS